MGKKTVTAPLKWTTAMKLLAIMRESNELAESRLMMALGFYTGLRISDILKLRWEDLQNPILEMTEQKTGKTRRINFNKKLQVITQEVKSIIQPLDSNQFIFKGKRGPNRNRSLTVVGANNRIKQIFERFDIITQNPSSHTLRKTFALRVYETNQRSEDALILLSEIFNHSNISITRKYIGITQERIANVYLSI
jgi:integrase|tara:strand:- start:3041 stop:3622 length:582 start_codon:yes stop_codon:yes gene_type:complete